MSSAPDYELRPARVDDFEALAALASASADTGRIRVAPKYVRNPVEAMAALVPELEWVVAESEDGLIGAAQVVFNETEIEDQRYRCALLSSLMVHPAHRRRGVAKALTGWRLDRAGPDAVVAAAIQTGNEGSFANAKSWATQIFGKLTLAGFRTAKSERPKRGVEIREPLDDSEWNAAAEGLERFEQGWNLRSPETGASLRERASRTLSGEHFLRYFVAVEAGQVVGGFELMEGGRLQTLVFEHVPLALRALNLVARVIPSDGELRSVSLSRVWYEAERKDVARALWSFARAASARAGNAVGTQFDTRSPLREVFPVKAWTPKGVLTVAVRSPVRLSEDRLLSPP